ncbi:hypothetical protein BDN70DRAFT_876554 [Pholiota conissans]|uniref:Uncharacterized protein n=1 Tax=Pholiota conissans TaxID=109636 RepID=A0A9P5Z4A2_9AGAR|nr:hypothetical protein BDN70DRAFT_876554 [Pholiota conissans]
MSSSSTSSPNSSQATSTIGVTQIFQGRQNFNDTFESNNAIAPGEVASQIIDGQQNFYGAMVNNNSVITNSGNVDQDNVNSTFQGDFYDTGASESIVSPLSQGTTPNAPPAASSPAPIVPAASAAQIITGDQIFHQGMTNTNVTTGVTGSAQSIIGDQVFNGPVVNNNTRSTNSNNRNIGNINSRFFGNNTHYAGRQQAINASFGAPSTSNIHNHLPQPHLLTNSSGQGAMPIQSTNDLVASLSRTMTRAQLQALAAQLGTLAQQGTISPSN